MTGKRPTCSVPPLPGAAVSSLLAPLENLSKPCGASSKTSLGLLQANPIWLGLYRSASTCLADGNCFSYTVADYQLTCRDAEKKRTYYLGASSESLAQSKLLHRIFREKGK